MANALPTRDQVPEEFTWNLKDMFESDEAWLREYEALKAFPERIAAYRGRLGESAETLLDFFRFQDEAELRLRVSWWPSPRPPPSPRRRSWPSRRIG